jgi:hypothetical protein
MKNILVLGLGEVGKSVVDLYSESKEYMVVVNDLDEKKYANVVSSDAGIYTEDMVPNDFEVDVLHVCIPYFNKEQFIEPVIAYIEKYDPLLVIINSTVDIGTTRYIYERTGSNIVHSPIMGVHPHLTDSIKIFKRIIGGCTDESIELACDHFMEMGIDCVVFSSPEDSEVAKMFSTTYYGMCIRLMQSINKFCEEHHLNFDDVYTKTNEIYNEGYTKMGKSNVIRPVLKYMGDGIGKHCVTANALILHRLDNKLFFPKIIASAGYNIPEKYKDEPKYHFADWLFCEYVGKEKSTLLIGEECGVSDVTIGNYLKKFNIPVRLRCWTEEEDKILIELSQEMTFKEISESGQINKTYDQIRNRVYYHLKLKSVYDPSKPTEETKKKISCALRNIDYDEFDDFLWKKQSRLHRKEYHDWRKKILNKYDYTCQKTKIKGGRLNVHHIIPWNINESLRYDIDNGIVLSEQSHIDFHKKYGYQNCNEKQLKEFLNESADNDV